MSVPVGITDIEIRWRPLTAEERQVAVTLLDDAWAIVTGPAGRPQLQADVDAGLVSIAQVRRVLATMVLRVLRNPDGKVSESIDDYTYRRADAVADGSLYLSADELAALTPAADLPTAAGAFTIRQVAQPGRYPQDGLSEQNGWFHTRDGWPR